jgi:hypothetical protein
MHGPMPAPYRRADNALEKLMAGRFGMDPLTAPDEVVVRAAEWLMWGSGAPFAQQCLLEVNQRRVAAGLPPVIAKAGHALAWEG